MKKMPEAGMALKWSDVLFSYCETQVLQKTAWQTSLNAFMRRCVQADKLDGWQADKLTRLFGTSAMSIEIIITTVTQRLAQELIDTSS